MTRRRARRPALAVPALAASLAMGGCNMIVTTSPMFSHADEAGAPKLRPGVWSTTPDKPCAFDEAAPLETWPTCASGAVVRDGAVVSLTESGGKKTSTTTEFVLAAGEPRVLQISMGGLGKASGLPITGYFYGGLRPTGDDDQGRITAYEAWPAFCGPPPKVEAGKAATGPQGTREPFAGLVMDKAGENCSAQSQDAVRNAAARSRALADSRSHSHWVRDGER
jgi:hypothetical protein